MRNQNNQFATSTNYALPQVKSLVRRSQVQRKKIGREENQKQLSKGVFFGKKKQGKSREEEAWKPSTRSTPRHTHKQDKKKKISEEKHIKSQAKTSLNTT